MGVSAAGIKAGGGHTHRFMESWGDSKPGGGGGAFVDQHRQQLLMGVSAAGRNVEGERFMGLGGGGGLVYRE